MSCKLERPSPQALWDKVSQDFSTTVLGGADIIPESNEHYVVALNYAMREEFYSLAESMFRENDPRYACCDNLIELAARDAVYRKAATPAKGYIKITGTAGVTIPQTLTFTIGSDKYIPAGSVPPLMPQSGEAIIMVQSQKTGSGVTSIQNITTGMIDNAPDGIDSKISLYGTMCGGNDEETCEQLRSRYLERLQYSPSADLKWIMNKVSEWPCVTDVCQVGNACCEVGDNNQPLCPDGLYLYVLFRNTFPCGIAPDCIIDNINEWLFGSTQGQGLGQVPFGVFGAVRYVKPAYINILIDGMACATSTQQAEVQSRIEDYISRICPSANMMQRSIERIIAQIVGDEFDFQIYIEPYTDGENNNTENALHVDDCGNVQILCDYKVCLNELKFVNMTASTGNC